MKYFDLRLKLKTLNQTIWLTFEDLEDPPEPFISAIPDASDASLSSPSLVPSISIASDIPITVDPVPVARVVVVSDLADFDLLLLLVSMSVGDSVVGEKVVVGAEVLLADFDLLLLLVNVSVGDSVVGEKVVVGAEVLLADFDLLLLLVSISVGDSVNVVGAEVLADFDLLLLLVSISVGDSVNVVGAEVLADL